MRAISLLVVLLVGCGDDVVEPGRAFVAPFDGQSAIAADTDLLVRTGGLLVPEDYPVPDDFIRVVDLTRGGLVEGSIIRTGDDLRFRPTGGWEADRRYGWTVDAVEGVPHGPEFSFPQHLVGTAVFDTSNRLAMLGATVDPDTGETCMVFSRPLTADDTGGITLTADDEPVDDAILSLIPDVEWGKPYELLPGDEGAGVVCMESEEIEVREGVAIRLWWGDIGPWHAFVSDRPVADLVSDLRRGNF